MADTMLNKTNSAKKGSVSRVKDALTLLASENIIFYSREDDTYFYISVYNDYPGVLRVIDKLIKECGVRSIPRLCIEPEEKKSEITVLQPPLNVIFELVVDSDGKVSKIEWIQPIANHRPLHIKKLTLWDVSCAESILNLFPEDTIIDDLYIRIEKLLTTEETEREIAKIVAIVLDKQLQIGKLDLSCFSKVDNRIYYQYLDKLKFHSVKNLSIHYNTRALIPSHCEGDRLAGFKKIYKEKLAFWYAVLIPCLKNEGELRFKDSSCFKNMPIEILLLIDTFIADLCFPGTNESGKIRRLKQVANDGASIRALFFRTETNSSRPAHANENDKSRLFCTML